MSPCQSLSYRYLYQMLLQRSFSKPISLCSSPRGSLLNSVYQIKHKLLVFISKAFTDNPALSSITHLAPRNQLLPPAGHETSFSLPLLCSQTHFFPCCPFCMGIFPSEQTQASRAISPLPKNIPYNTRTPLSVFFPIQLCPKKLINIIL